MSLNSEKSYFIVYSNLKDCQYLRKLYLNCNNQTEYYRNTVKCVNIAKKYKKCVQNTD